MGKQKIKPFDPNMGEKIAEMLRPSMGDQIPSDRAAIKRIAKATADDFYAVTSSQVMADGAVESLQGNAIIYTGYEWRARMNSGSSQYLSIGTVSKDGNSGSGRFMVNGQDEVGLDYELTDLEEDEQQEQG